MSCKKFLARDLVKMVQDPGHTTQEGQILKAFSLAHSLAIEIIKVDHLAVIELAKKANITTYDASYLWLVLHLQGELVTLDKKLRRVAAHSLP